MKNGATSEKCGSMTLRLEGAFDSAAAARALAHVAELPCEHVVVDLGHAFEISDVALAFLAGGLAHLPRKARVQGLSPRHERILEALGVTSLVGTPRHAEPV